jgi:glycosyltransferase involved in cell wall biosynthesis
VSQSSYKVVVGAGYWNLSGVHVFCVHLVRGLRKLGVDARLLLTEQDTWLVSLPPDPLDVPTDVPVDLLPVEHKGTWADHWANLIEYLEKLGPCVYLPNVDFRHSCVSPKLSSAISVVGILQGDDPVHYEHVERLGKYWDAVVCVSDELAERTLKMDPSLKSRLHTIPNAVPVPAACPPRHSKPGDPLKVIYHGVLNTYQKQILDVPKILTELERLGTPVQFTVAGRGPQEQELLEQAKTFLDNGSMRFLGLVQNAQIEELLREQDVYINTSKFEGMPHAMLEAMGAGCVPVVTDIKSGVPEVIRQGANGYRVPIGGVKEFAERLTQLQRDVELRRKLALEAHQTVLHSQFNLEAMVKTYAALFDKVYRDAQKGKFVRPSGPVLPPPATVAGLSLFPVEHAGFVAEVEQRCPTPARPNGQSGLWKSLQRAFSKLSPSRK